MEPTVWDDEDIALLNSEYPSRGSDIPELRSRYTAKQIRDKARGLHIKCVVNKCGSGKTTPVIFKGGDLRYD